MMLRSTADRSYRQPLAHCTMQSLAPGMGLYMPEKLPYFDAAQINALCSKPWNEMCFELASAIIGDAVEPKALKSMIERALNFPVVLNKIDDAIFSLELWHGPSFAFKDFGVRFMAELMAYFNEKYQEKLTILVATSGDTGGAAAFGFFNVPGIEVIILYPSGKVSEIQEKQVSTLGHNITACEIQGNFDDCQSLVKQALKDESLGRSYKMVSANSINIARLIPQIFYYFEAYRQWQGRGKWVCSVPSGNFGNLTAGLMAKAMGLPVHHFIAATNINKTVPDYLESGQYEPRASVNTISNAMDVGDPSNFVRIQDLYDHDINKIKADVSGYWATDSETQNEIRRIYESTGYITDPHGAIACLGLKKYLLNHGGTGFFLETAHPAKFPDIVEPAIRSKLSIPDSLADILKKEKNSVLLKATYEDLKNFLLSRNL